MATTRAPAHCPQKEAALNARVVASMILVTNEIETAFSPMATTNASREAIGNVLRAARADIAQRQLAHVAELQAHIPTDAQSAHPLHA